MAGTKESDLFSEKISPFLLGKMDQIKNEKGEHSEEYRALALQYKISDEEYEQTTENNKRHWEADLVIGESQEQIIRGLERLYDRSLVIEPTMICAAHCRYCLRANYNIFTLEEHELKEIAKYCGRTAEPYEAHEVLVTGGDPLIVPKRLSYLVEVLVDYAPNIKIVRIGTRLPQHAPERINNNVYEIFMKFKGRIRFEIATQINHVVELFPETIEKFKNLQALGVKVYSQNVILKHVNDNIPALVTLYNKLRELDFEPHYLFHCVPMKGMHHFRTSVKKATNLAKGLTNSGKISGRVKPMVALMTDIGKITLYDGVILNRNDRKVLLQSAYKYDDRMRINPCWKLPETAEVDENGCLRVWYLDGED